MRFRASACLAFVLTVSARAELDRFPVPPTPLSAASLTKLERLEALRRWDGVAWEWHAGDLAHGEDPAAEDGQWKPVVERSEPGAGALWMRARFTVPARMKGYDLTGAALFLTIDTSPAGTTPVILYLDGRRIALGTDLEPEALTRSLRPGQTFSVAIKLLATTEKKSMRTPTLRLMFAKDRPDPTHFRAECVSAAVLLPTIDHDPAALQADLARIASAVEAVNFQALEAGEQGRFDQSLRAAEAELSPLRPKLQTLSIQAIGNSHIDAAWRWPASETLEVVRDTFRSALQMLPEYPELRYTQADVQYNDWMARKYPALADDMQAQVANGRWSLVGGMWSEPDLNEPDGETMVRELLIGKRYVQAKYGKDVRIGWNVDSFGYSWQLPQVYKKSGVDFFVTQKMNWNESNRLPLQLFWWQSPDGSSVLTYFPMSYNGTTDPVQMAQELANARPLTPGLSSTMHLFGVGDHGGGPTRVELDEEAKWQDGDNVYPRLTISTPEEFFAGVAPKVNAPAESPVWSYKTLIAGERSLPAAADGSIHVPVWRDELYLETHRGTYTTQAKHKKNMRDAEEWLLDAEKLSSIAWAIGEVRYPQEPLNEAWKKVLFNTNHDLAAGSGIASIYTEAQAEYDAAHAATADATRQAEAWMASQADTRVEDAARDAAVIVTNTLAWPRGGMVEAEVELPRRAPGKGLTVRDAEGRRVPAQVLAEKDGRLRLLLRLNAVPALGFAVLRVSPGEEELASDLHASRTELRNEHLRVSIDPATGCLTHLVSLKDGFDSIADGGCGNQMQMFADTPRKYDAWNIDAGVLDKPIEVSAADSVELLEQGPLRARVRIRRHWGKSTFEQTLVLYAGSDELEVENSVDWHETHMLLKAGVQVRASSEEAAFEIPYGVVARPTTRANAVDAAKFEVPALRWADLGDGAHGLSLINNSKYGYDALAHELRISLLRSPVFPDPEADRGEQRCTYVLYPHAGDWKQAGTERRGYEFNYGLQAKQVPVHEGPLGREHSLAGLNADGVVLTALKKSEDGEALIARAVEVNGRETKAVLQMPGAPVSAREADMMEHAAGPALSLEKNSVALSMHPYEIKTVRVEYSK